MHESPFLAEKIYRVKQSKSLFGSENNSDNVATVSGEFKGLVQVFNTQRKMIRMENISKNYTELMQRIRDIYQVQMDRELPFDFESLEVREKEKESYTLLKQFLGETGVGILKIDEFISNFKF